MKQLKLAVLMGGKSDERAISLVTGGMIIKALDPLKYSFVAIDTAGANVSAYKDTDKKFDFDLYPLSYLVDSCSSDTKPDVAFIALHGRYGEDGTVQGMLELFDIPYVGSDVLGSALAMDKIMSRKMMEYNGIPIPAGLQVNPNDTISASIERIECEVGYPLVVKPNRQGSTIGLSIAKCRTELETALNLAYKYDSSVLIEQFVKGVEITVPVIGNNDLRVLPIVEIIPKNGFYDYHAKYTDGATEEIVPARIPDFQYKCAEDLAVKCHQALGCRGVSRTDMIIADEQIYVLETNTIPGMTPTSLLPRSAKAAGIEFPELIDILIQLALEKK